MKHIVLFSILLWSGFFEVNSLKCYVCDNCDDIQNAKLETCNLSTTEATSTSPGSSVTEAPGTNVTEALTTNGTESENGTSLDYVMRKKRHITKINIDDINGCYCFDEENCDCEYNKAERVARADEPVCYTVSYTVNNTKVTDRGCGLAQINNATFCNWVVDNVSTYQNITVECKSCNSDGCNNSSIIKHSVYLIYFTIVALFFK